MTAVTHSYCTYFDSGYLARGLTLIDSLRREGDDAPVWVLCLDDAARDYLSDLDDPLIRPILVDEIERANPELLSVKAQRSRMEYYFTCTPLLMRYVMDRQAQPGGVVIYLDADLYFFDSPALVLDALGEGSIGIIEHRYPKRLERRLSKYGRFNVGWVGIRDSADGRACVNWWSARCLEWCHDVPSEGQYADQGYLDSFPDLFQGVVSLRGAGLNLAPWNTGRHALSIRSDTQHEPLVIVDDSDPLVFFHFHGIKPSGGWHVTSQLVYGDSMGRILREQVYAPYLQNLDYFTELVKAGGLAPVSGKRGKGIRGAMFAAQRAALDRMSIFTGNAVRTGVRPIAAPSAPTSPTPN